MAAPDALVEVDPESIRGVLKALRSTSRACAAASGAVSTNLPMMPPVFHQQVQGALDQVARRLRDLAVELEYLACREAWRVSWLLEAGAGDVTGPLKDLLSDLAIEGRRVIGDLQREPGPEATFDDTAGVVHLVNGVADNLAQVWSEMEMLGRLGPNYSGIDPRGAERARQDAIATVLNLCEMGGLWDSVDTSIRGDAQLQALGRAVDWKDAAAGDLPRWVGHMGSGLVIGSVLRGLAGGRDRIPSSSVLEDDASLGAALQAGYGGVNRMNKIPADRDGRRRPTSAELVARVERQFSGFLGQPPPRRRPAG